MLIEDEGCNYTAAEYEQWLTETSFHQPRRISLNVPAPTASPPREAISPAGPSQLRRA